MRKHLKADEWSIIEEGFNPENQRSSESIFSIGNGKMGQRANFEETYSGSSLQGSYVAGVYFPDKTRVGWWKNGYPEYFAKIINSANWIGIRVFANDEELDLNHCQVDDFVRILNMKVGTLTRKFTVTLPSGNKLQIESIRFVSMADNEIGVIKYSVSPVNFSGKISFFPYLDGDVENEDSNYDEKFWNILESNSNNGEAELLTQTKKLDFRVAFHMLYSLQIDNANVIAKPELISTSTLSGNKAILPVNKAQTATIYKYVGVCSNLNYKNQELIKEAKKQSGIALSKGFDHLLEAHKNVWKKKWETSDIQIEGDIEAQQGIRFNIFQLNQTYTGDDDRLNVGPKGFTGEKYGGVTYWDTEAYCIPFFLSTAPSNVTKQLLIYRYKHLQKAIENAQKLGFKDGAALYPMVTINGEECHNEWEITFEEIHRNGAIAFAIHNYIRHTGDEQYLVDYGLEVLIGIARFWSQRITWSGEKQKFVMLGVTGPNEYENNVNNNWYTNKIATWCLKFTLESIKKVKQLNKTKYDSLAEKITFDYEVETTRWNQIIDKMHFPFNEKLNVFLQQDGFMDKEQLMASDIDLSQRPINQHWSWDRILRSCFIKQADTLQGFYLFENEFDNDTIKKHFNFYEPRTVHESSLSPCVHSILASKIGDTQKAYKLYLRTSRLDLDDYNNEVHEGLHITSMAGTWMSIVEGFGGKRVYDGKLSLNPIIPDKWSLYSFKMQFQGKNIDVKVTKQSVVITSLSSSQLYLNIYGKTFLLKSNDTLVVEK
ncbi:MAG: glycoside hydrolase family 65 protein [Marinilabiliaceae bacterium]|nr:glycoside hydrolase family 65 protein [Marinilabiliaceae bacterium]